VVTFTLWIYAIGVYGQDRCAALGFMTMNLKLFKTNVIIVGSLILIGLIWSATQGEASPTADTFEFKDIIFLVAGLYFAFAMVQTMVFVCKTITKIEHQREVSFSDYFNNLLLMFFFFIGIWFLRPKVNRLIATAEKVAY
jgi:nitrate reductase gamma subunit